MFAEKTHQMRVEDPIQPKCLDGELSEAHAKRR